MGLTRWNRQKAKERFTKIPISQLTGKSWVKIVYPLVKSLKKIPQEKLSIDFTTKLKWWFYNGTTGEALIEYFVEGETDKLKAVYVYDPISLINLSRQDLQKLKENQILFSTGERSEAMKF